MEFNESIKICDIIYQKKAIKCCPKKIEYFFEDKRDKSADIDVIVAGYGDAELTNLTVLNYLRMETKQKLNIIVVDSTGKESEYSKIIDHPQVSKILYAQDYIINYGKYGAGSISLSLMFQIAQQYSIAPHIFFSHNDMMAYKKDFLNFLMSKITETTRLASFTQRSLIPFTGCMLLKREVVEKDDVDWTINAKNKYTAGSIFRKVIAPLREYGRLGEKDAMYVSTWIDCGESFIYDDMEKGYQGYVCASLGGSQDYMKHPFSYFNITSREIREKLIDISFPIKYAFNSQEIGDFGIKYPELIRVADTGEPNDKGRIYWRYSFDDEGDLIFIHCGRGTSLRVVERWKNFIQKYI